MFCIVMCVNLCSLFWPNTLPIKSVCSQQMAELLNGWCNTCQSACKYFYNPQCIICFVHDVFYSSSYFSVRPFVRRRDGGPPTPTEVKPFCFFVNFQHLYDCKSLLIPRLLTQEERVVEGLLGKVCGGEGGCESRGSDWGWECGGKSVREAGE